MTRRYVTKSEDFAKRGPMIPQIVTGKTRSLGGETPGKMLEHFQALEDALKETTKGRSRFRAKMAEISERMKLATPNEKKDLQQAEYAEREALAACNARTYNRFTGILEDAKGSAAKKHTLNLRDESLGTAIRLIESAGSNLDFESRQQINQSLSGNQAHLRMIRNLYAAKSIEIESVSKLMYDTAGIWDSLGRQAGEDLLRNAGSVNSLSARLSKIAALEGVDFPQTVDPESVDAAMRTAAGLPEVPPEAE